MSGFLLQSDRLVQVKTIETARRDLVKGDRDRLIQVVQSTSQNTVKIPFYITVNDIVYSLCIKGLKNSLTQLKVTATVTWFEKNIS